jgi:hypothetical protein
VHLLDKKNFVSIRVKCPFQNLEFSPQTFEKSSNIIFHHIHQVGAELLQAHSQTDEETDMTKLVVAFRIL